MCFSIFGRLLSWLVYIMTACDRSYPATEATAYPRLKHYCDNIRDKTVAFYNSWFNYLFSISWKPIGATPAKIKLHKRQLHEYENLHIICPASVCAVCLRRAVRLLTVRLGSATMESRDVAAGRRRRTMSPRELSSPLRINASVKRARAVTLCEPKSAILARNANVVNIRSQGPMMLQSVYNRYRCYTCTANSVSYCTRQCYATTLRDYVACGSRCGRTLASYMTSVKNAGRMPAGADSRAQKHTTPPPCAQRRRRYNRKVIRAARCNEDASPVATSRRPLDASFVVPIYREKPTVKCQFSLASLNRAPLSSWVGLATPETPSDWPTSDWNRVRPSTVHHHAVPRALVMCVHVANTQTDFKFH